MCNHCTCSSFSHTSCNGNNWYVKIACSDTRSDSLKSILSIIHSYIGLLRKHYSVMFRCQRRCTNFQSRFYKPVGVNIFTYNRNEKIPLLNFFGINTDILYHGIFISAKKNSSGHFHNVFNSYVFHHIPHI